MASYQRLCRINANLKLIAWTTRGLQALPILAQLAIQSSIKGFVLTVNILYKLGYYFRRNTISIPVYLQMVTVMQDFAQRWQQPGDELKTSVPL